jgi:hypothetical protein
MDRSESNLVFVSDTASFSCSHRGQKPAPWHGDHAAPGPHPTAGKRIMSLISLIFTLIVVGVLLWLVNNSIPMDGTIKRILNMVVVVAVVVWLLNILGLMDSLRSIRLGR